LSAEGGAVGKRFLPPIIGERVLLRLLERRDLEATRSWRNQAQIRAQFFDDSIIAPEQHRSWFAAYGERDDDFVFIIHEHRELNRDIGQCGLYRIDWTRGTAEFGRLMIGDVAAAGRGLAREAVALLTGYGFNILELREIVLEVREDNAVARHIYEVCGFRERDARAGRVLMSRSAL